MRLRTFLAAGLLAALPLLAGDMTFEADTTHTHIGFTAKTFLFKVDGSFGSYHADISGDPKTLKDVHVNFDIDAKSINTGVEARYNHLRTADFFDV